MGRKKDEDKVRCAEVFDTPKLKSPPSVYFCNYRAIYPDSYPAKWDDEFLELLIQLYSKPGDLVLDPMGGSGESVLKALQLGRDAVYQDVNPEAYRVTLQKYAKLCKTMCKMPYFLSSVEDSRKRIILPADGRKAKLIITSPPFGLAISGAYNGKGKGPSGYSELNGDISNSVDYPAWRQNVRLILKQCYEALEPGGMLIVELRPRSKDGHSFPLNKWVWQDAEKTGFVTGDEIIEVTPPWRMWTMKNKEYDSMKPYPYHAWVDSYFKPKEQVSP